MIFLVCGTVLLAAYALYWQLSKANQRQAQTARLRTRLIELEEAEAAFAVYTSFASGYFAHATWQAWHARYQDVYREVDGTKPQHTDLSLAEKATVQSFLEHYRQGEQLRQAYNAAFVPHELRRFQDLFSRVEGRSLDEQQRTAIVTNEDNCLVVAGAGSGKTTTIIGKVQYVLARYGTRPDNILLISFTKKSADTLAERIGIDGVVPRTFHKFGKDVIGAVEGRQPSLYDESQFAAFIRTSFQQLMQSPAYAEQVTTYFVRHLKPDKPAEAFRNRGDYVQYLKDNRFRPYKRVARTAYGKTTYKQEVVKSVEECLIANFLLFNGVDYRYEAPYEHATASAQHAQWKPDFTITQDGTTVYLEHFGVDRDHNVPAFFAKSGESLEVARARYRAKMAWARQISHTHGTVLVESYSYERAENTLFENLRANLTRHGIVLRPKTPAEIWDIIAQAAEDEVDSFATLLQTFITLMKSNNYTVADVRAQLARIGDGRERERSQRFVDIVEPLYTRYEQELARRHEIDFSDLINQAAAYIQRGAYRKPYEYIIIDEFQDLSKGRYHLIRALAKQNPQCKLFCVGDDWQSIYRFAGSDLALFNEFSQYFGYTHQAKIETTYRFHEPLIGLSSAFITKNPTQTPKALRSGSAGKHTRHRIVYSAPAAPDDTAVLQQVLDELIAMEPAIAGKEILLLGRYSRDFQRVQNTNRVFGINASARTLSYAYTDARGNRAALHLPFLTVHKSKGLEADIVILLNCNSGKFGFPSEMADDPVLGLLLSEADRFTNGEERRLFYVALTRAKEQIILVSDPAFKSKFIAELEMGSEHVALKKCPVCVSADLVKKSGTTNGKPWAFYGCTNFPYGCEYREWIR